MLNAAIVGMGIWGQTLVRSVLNKSDKIQFTRGVTRTPSNVEEFAKEAGLPVTSDLSDVLGDAAISIIVLATPHSQHGEQIRSAAAAGKHVFCEKPLTLTASDAQASFDAANANGVLLGVAQNRRFLPSVSRLKHLVEDGQLGKLLHFEANFSGTSGYRFQSNPGGWRANDQESPAGAMTGRGLHMTDLMISLAGPAARVGAFSDRRVLDIQMDDTTSVMLKFASGCTGYLGSHAATGEQWRFSCFGSKGWAELRGHQTLAVRYGGDSETIEQFPAADIEQAELEAFADAIAGNRSYPVTETQAVNNIAILEAIVQSAQSGQFVDIRAD